MLRKCRENFDYILVDGLLYFVSAPPHQTEWQVRALVEMSDCEMCFQHGKDNKNCGSFRTNTTLTRRLRPSP
jgi:hypothetical protein